MSLSEKAWMLRLMMTILGKAIGRESLLPSAMTNHCRLLITVGAGPVMGLDGHPIFTKLRAVWHRLMCLRA